MTTAPTWADAHVAALARGETVQFRPVGRSMEPRIMSGALVTVAPGQSVMAGDAVLCRVGAKVYVHLVLVIRRSAAEGVRYQIGNNRGGTNGWITGEHIYGKVTKVEA